MKKRLALILVSVLAVSIFISHRVAQSQKIELSDNQTKNFSELKAQNFKAVAFGVSPKVSELAPAAPNLGQTGKRTADQQARAVPNNKQFRKVVTNAVHDADQALRKFSPTTTMPLPSLTFDGISSDDNASAYGFRIVPPDPNGDVGLNHYVQSVNLLTRVFDKNGAPLTPPFKLSSLFSVLGTVCSTRNDGDPIALYDALADRWILSQFCNNFPPFRQLIAVSRTGDPTGDYFVYEFVMPNVKFNDYPKLGVWSDGYYMTTDEFLGSDYAGSGVFAFDRSKMLAGDPTASFIYFDLASPNSIRIGGLLPSDLDGLNAPPDNAPNTFVGYTATEYGDAADALRLFDFHADFANPSFSTFTERAESPVLVAPFDPTSPDGRADIAQPPPGELLDSQSDRLMYRVAYRNFGEQQSLVINQTVRLTSVGEPYRAGVRVYELRRSSNGYAVNQQATVGSNDTNRWMGSAAQDYRGNLAVGYSLSSQMRNPSIFYWGKLANETEFRSEQTLINGTGVQTGFGSRWGDYSSINIDPTDDCTFWLTNEYYTAKSAEENPFGWLTRIGRFKFDECTPAPRAAVSGTVTNAANNQPIPNAIVTANAVYKRFTDSTGSYGTLTLVPNTYTITVSARGFRTQVVIVTITNGESLIRSFALEPTALFENSNINILSESCQPDNAIDPSETVTVNVGLQNTGARNTTNLTVTLLPTGGVVNPSQPQNYGAIVNNGSIVLRSFTFTASANLQCGDIISLTFQLQDGAENLGTIIVELNAGRRRTAFQENFDQANESNLPPGWTTSTIGGQDIWKTSSAQFQTPPLAAYSAASSQIGVNEMTSPQFRINSNQAELSFRNRYDLETTFLRNRLYDGAVLEIKIGSGFFQDILQAGGRFTMGGYDGAIEACCQNPLGGRLGWSGKSGPNQTPQFINATVKLPARAAGKNVQLRWRVGSDNGTSSEGQFVDNIFVSDGFECSCQINAPPRTPFDFDADGRTDFSIFRPSDDTSAPDFYVRNSSDNSIFGAAWGSVGDEAINADYDGDGRTDFAVFRPSNGIWFVLRSSNNTIFPLNFGQATDKRVPADYDGDGKADIAVYRPSNGVWYIQQSSDNQLRSVQFGVLEDFPVSADYDGDGKADIAVFRPSNGVWYIQGSQNGFSAVCFGATGDKPVTGDFDADGKADLVVFRPSNGAWYLQKTLEGFAAVQFGASDDKLLQADFDGDRKRDVAVYRPTTGVWYFLRSSTGTIGAIQFGAGGDTPLPTIYVP